MESAMGRHPGRYSGNAEDWPQWRRKWLPFLREIEGLWPTITDSQRLALLRSALDDAGAMHIDQEIEENPDLGYDAYWAKLDLEFGAEDKEVLRRKLQNIKAAHHGKLSEKTWRDLYAQMSTLALQVGDITDTELGRMLINAIPTYPWKRKIAQEEDKKTERGTIVLEGLPSDVSPTEVEAMITMETGSKPHSVRRIGNRVKVNPVSEEHRNQIKMLYDRQRLQGGQVIKVSPDTSELGAKEINDLMIRWLRMEQRIGGTTEREPSQPRQKQRPRWHRDIEVDSDGLPEDTEVSHVGKGKDKKRPPTPPKEKVEEQPKTQNASSSQAQVVPPQSYMSGSAQHMYQPTPGYDFTQSQTHVQWEKVHGMPKGKVQEVPSGKCHKDNRIPKHRAREKESMQPPQAREVRDTRRARETEREKGKAKGKVKEKEERERLPDLHITIEGAAQAPWVRVWAGRYPQPTWHAHNRKVSHT
jgi:hypothetical protein